MPDLEQDIAAFLTLDGHVFLAPQYDVAYNHELDEGGSCPDFVALDMKKREVVVVEISSASNVQFLTERVRDRATRWYKPIKRKMEEAGIVDDSWSPPRFLGFIRQDNLSMARQSFEVDTDVAFWAIEDATFLWKYWDERMAMGLPR